MDNTEFPAVRDPQVAALAAVLGARLLIDQELTAIVAAACQCPRAYSQVVLYDAGPEAAGTGGTSGLPLLAMWRQSAEWAPYTTARRKCTAKFGLRVILPAQVDTNQAYAVLAAYAQAIDIAGEQMFDDGCGGGVLREAGVGSAFTTWRYTTGYAPGDAQGQQLFPGLDAQVDVEHWWKRWVPGVSTELARLAATLPQAGVDPNQPSPADPLAAIYTPLTPGPW